MGDDHRTPRGPEMGGPRTGRRHGRMGTMKRFMWILISALAASPGLAGCGSPGQQFAAGITETSTAVLLEGLPHPAFESELLEKEKASKPVQQLHGYPFYEEALALRPEDAKRLAQVLSEGGSLKPFEQEKKCGGFHPDYAVEWRTGADARRALICFGCDEVKLFGPGVESRHDLSAGASKELEEVLGGYRKNRPAADGAH